MTTQEERWRRDGNAWLRSRDGYASNINTWLAAAQKYSPSDAERAVVEAAASGGFYTAEYWCEVTKNKSNWAPWYIELAKAIAALHAERTPPKVDHLAEARRLVTQMCRTDHAEKILAHLAALEEKPDAD